MRRRKAVVLLVDGLRADFLGPYGNTWCDTPTFNALAARSLLLDQFLTDTTDVGRGYQSLLAGRHALFTMNESDRPTLASQLAAEGRTSVMLTDDRTVAELEVADAFSSTQIVDTSASQIADEVSQTGFARLVAGAWEMVDRGLPDLLWIQSRGLFGEWDAPYALREQFREQEDDPTPPDAIEPPRGLTSATTDPDELQAWQWAYAGQVQLIDECLRPLLDRLSSQPDPFLLLVLGNRGYPLGDHGFLGSSSWRIYSEWVHVPCLIRCPSVSSESIRSSQLFQPQHVHSALQHWLELPSSTGTQLADPCVLFADPLAPHVGAPLAIANRDDHWAIRTPPWFATGSIMADGSCAGDWQLFLKPDDRFEVNDAADRGPAVLQAFQRLASQVRGQSATPSWPVGLPLEEVLLERLE